MNDYVDNLLNKVIGDTIRKEREKRNLTLDQLAAKANITKQNLYYYEIARNRIKVDKFINICKALDLDVSDTLDKINIEYLKNAKI